MTKQQAINMIQSLPAEEFSVDELGYHFSFWQKIDSGVRDMDSGAFATHEETAARWSEGK